MKTIKKYIPDLIIITGIYILSYNLLLPPETTGVLPKLTHTNYHTEQKVLGIILIVIGIDIIIRKYLYYKNKK